jgi:hypothetical protein
MVWKFGAGAYGIVLVRIDNPTNQLCMQVTDGLAF